MAILLFTLSEEGVSALREALTCLSKFSDEVSLEARKDKFILTSLNATKSAYASFTFATNRFFSKYQYDGHNQGREKFFCTLYSRVLIAIFRSRGGGDPQNTDKQSAIDRCDVAIEDGPDVKSRFIAKIVFRNGCIATHKLPFEVVVPVHAKFNGSEASHHWRISSRTLRQLMEHFGPGVDLLDINSDGEHINFTCFTEKSINGDEVLKKPLHTSIAVELDEFDDVDIEDKLHIVVSVKDFRAIIQHAGITSNDITARYSVPARPIQLCYQGDGISCEFLMMTVGERGNPGRKTKKKQANGANAPNQLEATSRRTSVAPTEPPRPSNIELRAAKPAPVAPISSVAPLPKPSSHKLTNFQIRPSQMPPPSRAMSDGLFVDNDFEWEPVRDEDDDDDAMIEWDQSYQPDHNVAPPGRYAEQAPPPEAAESGMDDLEPTQKLSEARKMALFYDGSS